jgi:outer membrane protein TolC
MSATDLTAEQVIQWLRDTDAEFGATKTALAATKADLAATRAELERLRALVAKEMGALYRLSDEGLEDDQVYFAMRRLIIALPAELRPADPANMVREAHEAPFVPE